MNVSQWSILLRESKVGDKEVAVWAPIFAEVIQDNTFSGGPELCAFLGQIFWESDDLKDLEENLNYSTEGLLKTFGTSRISPADADRFGRNVRHPADPRFIANTVYGGSWGGAHLGNTCPTDGYAFRGSGLIQITGRTNFQLASIDTGIDLIASPDLLRLPGEAPLDAAIGYWKRRVVGRWADPTALRRAINGGTLGLQETIDLTEAVTLAFNALPPDASLDTGTRLA
jgi:putative chitinase